MRVRCKTNLEKLEHELALLHVTHAGQQEDLAIDPVRDTAIQTKAKHAEAATCVACMGRTNKQDNGPWSKQGND